nr:hypothetical protein BaRGS_029499 [Batillaria attramentaria]
MVNYSMEGRTYRYIDPSSAPPLYPFGYGLSYTTFNYTATITADVIHAGEPLKGEVTVSNEGNVVADEVIQVYIRWMDDTLPAPRLQLAWFDRVTVAPGQNGDVTVPFEVEARTMALWISDGWRITPGQPAVAIPRLGIGPYQFGTECLRGDVDAGNATAFPQALGLAATFSPDLIYRVAEATGVEVRGKHNDYVKQGDYSSHTGASCFSPVINIMRDPSINGVPSCANHKLLTYIARFSWNFTGYVISDGGAIPNIINDHHYFNNSVDTVSACVNAGCNMELGGDPKSRVYLSLVDAVKQGKVTEAKVREMVAPLFYTRMRLGEFDPPEMNPYSNLSSADVETDDHKALAVEAAIKSFVLLKNDGTLPFQLPYNESFFQSIGVVGPMANNSDQIMGDYPPQPPGEDMVNPLQGLKQMAFKVQFASGCDDTHCRKYNSTAVVNALKDNQVNFVLLGTGQSVESEGNDRPDLELPGYQKQLLLDVIENSPHYTPIVLLLFNAGPLNISFADQHPRVSAILECFFPAQAAGAALRQILANNNWSGAISPAGRLPFTWPLLASQIPPMVNYSMEGRTYRYTDPSSAPPLYPFGYGLSYTKFHYEATLNETNFHAGEPLRGEVTVSMDDDYGSAAEEVIQVYIRWMDDTLPAPRLQLAWFDRVTVEPRRNLTVPFEVEARSMALWMNGGCCFSPVINIMRDPRWGRNQETYGEDPYMSGIYAANFIRGLQGNDTRYVSEFDWRMTFLPAFKRCVEAGTYNLMCSYNRINGVPSCANKELLTDILRNEWNFTGYVISDGGAVENIITKHHYFNNSVDTVAACLNAGCSIELDPRATSPVFLSLVDAVKQGKVTEARVREMITPMFYTRMRLGEFDPPEMNPYSRLSTADVETDDHKALAVEAAIKSFVLLKNDGTLPLQLPMNESHFQSIGVVGPMANTTREIMGDYSPRPPTKEIVTPLEGLSQLAYGVQYAAGCDDTHCMKYNRTAVIGALKYNQVNFVVLGTGPQDVPIVLLLLNAGPLNISFADQDPRVSAIIECFFPAQAAGTALARIPPMVNYSMEGRTYRYTDPSSAPPLYPFGYGLSYTKFHYTATITADTIKAGEPLKGEVTVANTGQTGMPADEVIQVYIRWMDDTLPAPRLQLAWFDRVTVPPGNEGVVIPFTVEARTMALWINGGWNITPGLMEVYVGGQQPFQKRTAPSNVVTMQFTITGSKYLGRY